MYKIFRKEYTMTDLETKKFVEKIKSSYTEPEKIVSDLDALKALDKKVKKPAKIFAYTYGTIGSLVLGTGMCFAMKIIGASISALMPVGIGVGIFGIMMLCSTYPIHNKIMAKRKKKYSKEIIARSDELLNK